MLQHTAGAQPKQVSVAGSMDGSAFPAPMPMSPYSQVAMPMAPGMMLPPGTPPHGGMMPVYPNPFGYYQMPYPGGMYWPYDPSANAMGSPMGAPCVHIVSLSCSLLLALRLCRSLSLGQRLDHGPTAGVVCSTAVIYMS